MGMGLRASRNSIRQLEMVKGWRVNYGKGRWEDGNGNGFREEMYIGRWVSNVRYFNTFVTLQLWSMWGLTGTGSNFWWGIYSIFEGHWRLWDMVAVI